MQKKKCTKEICLDSFYTVQDLRLQYCCNWRFRCSGVGDVVSLDE